MMYESVCNFLVGCRIYPQSILLKNSLFFLRTNGGAVEIIGDFPFTLSPSTAASVIAFEFPASRMLEPFI
jgi:hypothetical protein